MKTAKEIRIYHIQKGKESTMGPACPGCGILQKDSTVYAHRGSVGHDEYAICPDCGRDHHGEYLIVDKDSTAAIWPFPITGQKILLKSDGTWLYDPMCYQCQDFD